MNSHVELKSTVHTLVRCRFAAQFDVSAERLQVVEIGFAALDQ